MGKPGADFGQMFDALEARVRAIEIARSREIQWTKPRLRIDGVPNGSSVDTTVNASWVPLDAADVPVVVWLALDGAPGSIVGPYPSITTWEGLALGEHYISAFIDGVEVARETWVVKEF